MRRELLTAHTTYKAKWNRWSTNYCQSHFLKKTKASCRLIPRIGGPAWSVSSDGSILLWVFWAINACTGTEIQQLKRCIILGFWKRNGDMKRNTGPNMMFYRQFRLRCPVKCMFSQKRLLISQVLLNFASSTSSERSTLDCLRAALPLDRRTASMIGSDTRTTLLSSKPSTRGNFACFDLSDIGDFV